MATASMANTGTTVMERNMDTAMDTAMVKKITKAKFSSLAGKHFL